MIVIEIKGPGDDPSNDPSKLAKRIASAEQQGGKVVRLYEHDTELPAKFPTDADIVIVVTQT